MYTASYVVGMTDTGVNMLVNRMTASREKILI